MMVKLSGSGHWKILVSFQTVSGEMISPAHGRVRPSSCAQSGLTSAVVSRVRYSFWRSLNEYSFAISCGVLCEIAIVKTVSCTISVCVFLLPFSSISVTFSVFVSVWVSESISVISHISIRRSLSCASVSVVMGVPASYPATHAEKPESTSSHCTKAAPSFDVIFFRS